MTQSLALADAETAVVPIRIQRSIKRGWKLPPNSVIVTRPGLFGNPFVGPFAVEAHRLWITEGTVTTRDVAKLICDRERNAHATGVAFCPGVWNRTAVEVLRRLNELRGKNLACYCALEQQCHADTLLELANRPPASPAESTELLEPRREFEPAD